MFKKIIPVLIVTFLIALGVIGYSFFLITWPVSSQASEKDFLITKGSSVSLIGRKLEEDGLIRSAHAFRFYVSLNGLENKIQAGEYSLKQNLSLLQIVEYLKKGPKEVWVTIPEGLRHDEIAERFATALDKNQEFVDEFITLAKKDEGYLFPDTYLFPKEASVSRIILTMKSNFEKRVGSDISYRQLVVASMIERETKGDQEKPVVAGIIYKREQNDWPLQIDATIQYAKGSWKPILSSDKNLDSKYNTYKYLGLPPTPISNPGLKSILAAKFPQSSEYWYYIHSSSGQIYYATTLQEHNLNIDRYLR